MTTTVDRPVPGATKRRWRASKDPSGEPARPVPPPPRVRRRWGLFAAMAAVVCLGALGNLWLHEMSTDAQQVVAARSMIARGQIITRADLVAVQVGLDPALHPVPAAQIDTIAGQRAALDVAGGSLLTAESVTDDVVPARGMSVVGVAVPAGLMPGTVLLAGDTIRVVATPGPQEEATPGPQRTIRATMLSAAAGADTGQGSQTILTVQVPQADAAELAALAATGKVAIVLDSRER